MDVCWSVLYSQIEDAFHGILEACSALQGFQPSLVGGSGNLVQICAYTPDVEAVVSVPVSLRRLLARTELCSGGT